MLANNVNDEGADLRVMTITLKVVCYESLGLEDPFQGTCFGHTMPKACKYNTTKDKVCVGLHDILI